MDPALRYRDLREGRALRLGRLLQLGVVLDQDVRDDHVRAHARKGQRVLAPQPAGGAGDDGNPAFQIEHRSYSPVIEF